MKITVCGALPPAQSFGLAASVAAILGGLAGQKTLLVDGSLRSDQARQQWDCQDPRGLECLLDSYIRTRQITAENIRRQIIKYSPPESRAQAIDFLPGPVAPSPSYDDRLVAHRGQEFFDRLVDACLAVEYQDVVVNIGQALDTLRGEELLRRCDLVVVIYDEQNVKEQWAAKRLRIEHFATGKWLGYPEGRLHFAHPEFFTSLESRDKKYSDAGSRFALEVAERLYPKIGARLTDSQGLRLRPYHGNLLKQLFS